MGKRKFYIVRLRADDRRLAVGTSKECAAALKMSMATFLTTVSRCRSGVNMKYEIDVEEEDDSEYA